MRGYRFGVGAFVLRGGEALGNGIGGWSNESLQTTSVETPIKRNHRRRKAAFHGCRSPGGGRARPAALAPAETPQRQIKTSCHSTLTPLGGCAACIIITFSTITTSTFTAATNVVL